MFGSHTLQSAQSSDCAVGRLYPDHVAFKSYRCPDDNLRVGDKIGMRDNSLKALVAG